MGDGVSEFLIFTRGPFNRAMRKTAFCIYENKTANQLRNACAADQRHCFRFIDSTTPLLPKSEISGISPSPVVDSPVCAGPGRKPRRQGFFSRRCSFDVYKRDHNVCITRCLYIPRATQTHFLKQQNRGARWLSGRASDSGTRGRGAKPTSALLCP